jgi:uncharacterized membrane protein
VRPTSEPLLMDRRYARLWVTGTLVALILLVLVLNLR